MMALRSTHEKNKWISFFLSALVLPGLGQLQLGKRKTGWAIILFTFAALIITFAKFMMGVLKVAEAQRFTRPPRLDVMKTLLLAFQKEQSWIFWGLGILFVLWLGSILDILFMTEKKL
ncbi:MAG: hypothetical protein U1F57_05965 [bacterium]